ncbi:glutaredoxin 2 [Providencia alcalifaciens]|uniref:Glutaredoxin, GrxB family n=1 Tax=Providencia alcalifaciens 205/92 TaxID=1256988 RepID=A0AAV3M1H4_9GAMM|nr:glutaredoxin 2 [Providencia alcalifaciens]EUD07582.1 glutaredoxin, GrxB family [Providencia alcalifaciens R90-1475]EUD09557.1 glutaredoxin, GrxB family [Providencia alcalifaciens 205/92]MTC17040.1 glutaredoxin 2 [Providencia alcalifaciens]MTC32179.1 glutaredoxin 2 [Providencia alcalifaciens]MTC64429.1 glutaredoxin 2 [Providencia alcalifaciens]
MKLYIYDHCPFCVRARMIFGLKKVAVEEVILLDNDIETPTRMIGRKMVPILQKDDGSYLPESLDIVRYIDQLSEPRLAIGNINPEIDNWYKAVSSTVSKLVTPRFTESEFPEIATAEAKATYIQRVSKFHGDDLSVLRKETHTLLIELEPYLDLLDVWLEKRNKALVDINDFIIFPVLRSLSIVKEIGFSTTIHDYMDRTSKVTGINLLFNQAK